MFHLICVSFWKITQWNEVNYNVSYQELRWLG